MSSIRIENLLKTRFRRVFKTTDIFTVAYLEQIGLLDEELLLEKAYYKSFYKTFNLILRLQDYKNVLPLKIFGENRYVSFCRVVFSANYYALFRDRKGEEFVRRRIFNSQSNSVAFHFSNSLSLTMFFNFHTVSVTRILNRMDYFDSKQSQVVHERYNKKVYTQTKDHVIPQYIQLLDRKISPENIRSIFESMADLNRVGFLGYNTNLINLCFIVSVYFFIFIMSVFFQVIFTLDVLFNHIGQIKR